MTSIDPENEMISERGTDVNELVNEEAKFGDNLLFSMKQWNRYTMLSIQSYIIEKYIIQWENKLRHD